MEAFKSKDLMGTAFCCPAFKTWGSCRIFIAKWDFGIQSYPEGPNRRSLVVLGLKQHWNTRPSDQQSHSFTIVLVQMDYICMRVYIKRVSSTNDMTPPWHEKTHLLQLELIFDLVHFIKRTSSFLWILSLTKQIPEHSFVFPVKQKLNKVDAP